MKICGIYKITSPTGAIYIGQSKDCNRRKKRYENCDCKRQSRLYNSIKKHGWDKHIFEIIHECNPDELNKLECYYIIVFDTFNTEHGMNLVMGQASGERSEETKRKNSNATKQCYDTGKKERPAGNKNGMFGNGHKLSGDKNGRYGKPVSLETREKISKANIQRNRINGPKKLSEEHKQKIALASMGNKRCLGRKLSLETRLKIGVNQPQKRLHKAIRS